MANRQILILYYRPKSTSLVAVSISATWENFGLSLHQMPPNAGLGMHDKIFAKQKYKHLRIIVGRGTSDGFGEKHNAQKMKISFNK